MISKDPIGTLSGPYLHICTPFGRRVEQLDSNQWFLQTQTGVYEIEQFRDQPRRFILPQSYPVIEKKTLKSMIKFLLSQKKRIVLCT